MRVALVIERFEDAPGGGEQVAWNVARELVRAGDDVHVLCRYGEPQAGITLTCLAGPGFWQPLRVLDFARRVRRALADANFDAVHAFSRTLDQDVFHIGGGSHANYMQKTYGRRGARWRRLSPRHRTLLSLERRIFRNPKLLGQCVSRMVQREIATRYGVPESRLPVIHCGVDPKRFAPQGQADARQRLRAERGAEDATVWLFAGSGWRRKGLDLAIEALANAEDRCARLWVAGKDDPRRWLRLARAHDVEDRVQFLGLRGDLESVYAACDGLLFPTRYDAFGLVCLEAAAAALPVIVSTNAGASELFEDCGEVIAEPENPACYAHAMDRLSTAHAREALGARAQAMAAGHDWRTHVAKLRALYQDIDR